MTRYIKISSGPSAGATPDPIPNSVVKPGNADDTGGTGFQPVRTGWKPVPLFQEMAGSARPTWESRPPPELNS